MIRLESITKRFPNGQVAVDDLSLEVGEGEICMLIGPSGCGKTTTLKMVNRLIEPSAGRIVIDGEDVTSMDPVLLRRRIGYVIQHVGLFPHLTVAKNVGTVPKLLGWDRGKTAERVDELLRLVGLDPAEYGSRYPDQLSGGQRQRVGVARALAADPPVLLMDEPFGAIDPIARERLQNEFLRLHAEVRKTILFVTHDVDEAVKLGDRIAVLRQGGVLEQYDTPSEILARPANAFVADFMGADRGLKRLQVTVIDTAVLEKPPVVALDAALSDARRTMDAEGAPWAIVLDPDEHLHGFLRRTQADGEGAVSDRASPMDVTVQAYCTLKDALSQMLLHDEGWVAVLDGQRYLGVLTPASLYRAGAPGAPST